MVGDVVEVSAMTELIAVLEVDVAQPRWVRFPHSVVVVHPIFVSIVAVVVIRHWFVGVVRLCHHRCRVCC